MENREIASVVVKLEGLEKGVINEELKKKICEGWDVVNTLPVEEDGVLYLIFTLSRTNGFSNKKVALWFIVLLLIIQTVILYIGV